MYISIISLILITVLFILIIYTICFSDVRDKGFNGYLSRLITKKVPNNVYIGIKYCIGNSIVEYIESYYDYVVNRRNPVMQIIYLLLINIAYIIWLIYGSQLLPTYLASSHHNYMVFAMLMTAQYSYYLACTMSPGIINKDTVQCFNHQPYDGLLYIDGTTCSSCNILKPARSKHCTLCGYCVPIFDHHCIWINQCVGEQNHRYFLIFLFTNMSFFFYGSYVLFLVIASEVFERNLLSATFVNRLTGHRYEASVYIVVNFILLRHFELVCLFMFAFVMGIAVLLFLLYNIYLLYNGTTTNETFKYETFQSIYVDMVAAHKRYLQHNLESITLCHTKKNQTGEIVTASNTDSNILDQTNANDRSKASPGDIIHSPNMDITTSGIATNLQISETNATLAVSLESIKHESDIIGCAIATTDIANSIPTNQSDHHSIITNQHDTTTTTTTRCNRNCGRCNGCNSCSTKDSHDNNSFTNNNNTITTAAAVNEVQNNSFTTATAPANKVQRKEFHRDVTHTWHPIRIVCEEYDDLPQMLALDPGIWPVKNIYRIGLLATCKRIFWPTSEISLNNLYQHKEKNE